MLLVLLLPLACWIATGIEAELLLMQHYGRPNDSMCLHVQLPPPYAEGRWKKQNEAITTASLVNPKYKLKMVFNPENLSLCINNLSESDAGVYEAHIINSNFTLVTERHQVTVQGMVPRPVMAVHASNVSAGPCRVTVNCSVQDDWVATRCDAHDCRTLEASIRTFNISVWVESSTAVCRANNHVSTNKASVDMDSCFDNLSSEPKEELPKGLVIIIVVVSCSLFCVCVVVLVWKFYDCWWTPTAPLIHSQPVDTPSQDDPRASTPSSHHAEHSYENAEPAVQAAARTADTIYSVPNAPVSAGQEDAPSAAATHETQQSSVDTVYCLLQRPGNMT
ncbi:unnamed protein product [Ophioblennius macclurei]